MRPITTDEGSCGVSAPDALGRTAASMHAERAIEQGVTWSEIARGPKVGTQMWNYTGGHISSHGTSQLVLAIRHMLHDEDNVGETACTASGFLAAGRQR
jgi:hypothetical protein